MKIIFDNLAFSLQTAGGVSAVWAGLLDNIPEKYIYKYLEWNNKNIFNNKLNLNKTKVKKNNSCYPKLERLLNVNEFYKEKFIFHSSVYRTCTNKKAINIITVHDFIDKKYNPNYLKKTLRWFLMKKSIKNANAVVCISQNTKQDLLRYIPNLEELKIHVINNGKSDSFRKINCKKSSEKYVLFVGKRNRYKNFKILVEALEKNNNLNLKLVGGGELKDDEIKLLSKISKKRYLHFEQVSNEELNLLYNQAFCLVYPSIYEGFGIPVIEAQSAGCPIIAANRSSLPEIIGESGILLDDLSSAGVSDAIKLLENNVLRDKYIRLGFQNAKRFSWQKMAEEYLILYNRLWETC